MVLSLFFYQKTLGVNKENDCKYIRIKFKPPLGSTDKK